MVTNAPGAYESVRGMIEANAISYVKPLYSEWFIEREESVQDLSERMLRIAD